MAEYVKVEHDGRVAIITLDHPPVNALSAKLLEELEEAYEELDGSDETRAIVIRGGGEKAFVAGADITEFAKIENADQARAVSTSVYAIYNKIERSPKPFIAAINGVALGGGLELAMACHMRIIGDRAKVGQPEINLGIIPGWGGTQRLPRLVGTAKALELILTGDSITAQEAYRLNLVNKVVPSGEVLKTARDLAKKISQKGGLAVQSALQAVVQGGQQPLDEGLALEAGHFSQVAISEDAREGASAFLQKRQPAFKDR